MSRLPPWLLVLIAAASVQLGAALARTLFAALGPDGTVLLRVLSGAVILTLVHRPPMAHVTRHQWGWIFAFGLSLAAMNFSIYQAFARMPLGTAVTVEFVGPLVLALGGSRRLLDLLWASLAGTGIVLLGDLSAGHGLGMAFALSAGFWWAVYILVNRRLGSQLPSSLALTLAMVVAATLLFPIAAHDAVPALRRPALLLIGVGVGLLSSVIPYTLEMEALRQIPPHVFGVLMSTEPALAALAGFLVLDQRLAPPQWLAILLVTLASAGASATHRPSDFSG